MNNKNELTFMKVEEGLEVDWAHTMFNNLCSGLDRWTKMQQVLDSKRGTSKWSLRTLYKMKKQS